MGASVRYLLILTSVLLAVSCGGASPTPTAPTPTPTPSPSTPTPTPTLASLTIEPSSVTAGASVQGTATLNATAPADGVVVTLSSSEAAATTGDITALDETIATAAAIVPASITIPAGATSGTFTITTSAVSAATDVTITGSAGGATRTATLRVTPATAPPPAVTVASVSVDPSFIGGLSTTGTVTLTGSAPTGGLSVTLASSASALRVPATITIAAGATSGTFAITSDRVSTDTDVTITASASGVTRTAQTRLRPPPEPPTLTEIRPIEAVRGESVSVTLTGTRFVEGRTTVAVSGEEVTVSDVTISSATRLTATFTIAGGATISDRKVTVTTPEGTSNDVTFTVRGSSSPAAPTLTAVSPTSGVQGTTVAITLTGTGFVSGATVSVSGSGITVNSVSVVSSTSITASFVIDGSAATGARNVTVTTAGASTGAQTFTVTATADVTAPTVSSTKIAETSLGDTSISLSWAKATDDVTAQSSLVYKVYMSGANPSNGSFGTVAAVEAGTLVSTSTDISSITISSGITAGNSYYFNVIVIDGAGNKTLYSPLGELFKSNLLALYPFDGNTNDVSSSANNGVLVGSPSLTTDRFGFSSSAYSLVRSSSQYIRSTSNIGVTGASSRTLSIWLKPGSATISVTEIVASFGTDSGGGGTTFGGYYASGSNKFVAWCYQGSCDFDTGVIATTSWEHWVLTYDGTTYVVYKNGAQVASQARSLNTGASPLSIGNGPVGSATDSARYFDGLVDDTRVYGTALSATEVSRLYNATRP